MRAAAGVILILAVFGIFWFIFWGEVLADDEWIHDGDDPETIWQRSLPDSEEVARFENGNIRREDLAEGPGSGADRED